MKLLLWLLCIVCYIVIFHYTPDNIKDSVIVGICLVIINVSGYIEGRTK